jgi:hypothetical protein
MSAIRPKFEFYQESTRTLVTPGLALGLAERMEAIIIELNRVIASPGKP